MNDINSADSISSKEMYERIAYDNSYVYETQLDGTIKITINSHHQNYLNELCRIDLFVEEVLSSELTAFKITKGKLNLPVLNELPLAKYFSSVIYLYHLVSPEYEYSANVELFFNCCRTLELWKESFKTPRSYTSRPNKHAFELFNDLIGLIRTESNKPEFKAKVHSKKKKPQARFRSAARYIEQLLGNDGFAKLQVLRVDFYYKFEHAQSITAEEAKLDLEHFLNNMRGKPTLFANCVGYIWKLEYGPEKGYHFHLIFFYNGREILKDAYWADLTGKYWEKITKSKGGGYYNCNASKSKYKRLGIGMINHTDFEKRNILLNDVIGYLVKTDQFLKVVKIGNTRCFGKGAPPKRKSNAGAPRK